ncbi:MAG: hypothetical protein IPN19_07675 [Elusimicrobia bacterium]|nr:hypothetical protein [Elusimicrobiota bacterium]
MDGALGETLGLSSPANLIRATFVVESAVMNLKSAEVQSKDKRLFVQESKPVMDLNQVEKKLTAVSGSLAEAQGQFTKAERDFSNGAVASQSLLTYMARATGQTDVAVFQEPDDLKSLRQEANSLGVLSSQVTENMKVGNYQEVAEALPDLTVRTEVFKARSETLAVQAEMTKGFFKEIRNLTTDLSAVNKVVDVGDLAGKPITMEAVTKGYEWFPAPEKKAFADRASHAQETLVPLVEAGAVDADRALDWALSLKIAKDKVLGAGPGKLSDRISVAAAHPQATLKEASSEAADFYVFNTLSTYAETSPKTMMAVGYVGLGATKVSNALGKAAGVGLMVVFPVSSVSGFAAGFVADQGLQAAGVNEDLSGFMGITSGMLVGGRVATIKRVASLEKGWAARIGANQRIAQAVQGFKAGFKEIMQGTQKVAQGEAGHVLVGPAAANEATMGSARKTLGVAQTQALNKKPWGNEDPFHYFMKRVNNLDMSTPPNKAVFYSGPGSQDVAFEHKLVAGKWTIEDTAGGKWLDSFDLYGLKQPSPITKSQADTIWILASKKYAENASGEITLYVHGSSGNRIFYQHEFPTLQNNKKIHKWAYKDQP